MPTLAETLAAGADELAEFNALLAQYLDALAEAQANQTSYVLWVDAIAGDNANDGLTAATAKQTIGAALALTPPGSNVRIHLLSDYAMEANIATGGRFIYIRGLNASAVITQRLFTQTVAGGAARQLDCDAGGQFMLRNLDVRLAKTTVTVGAAALVVGVVQTLILLNCGVEVESGVTTCAVMNDAGVSILEASNITALDDAIAGHWVRTVSAGVNPNTLGRVLTNLATL